MKAAIERVLGGLRERPGPAACLIGSAFAALAFFVWTDGRHYIDAGDSFYPIDPVLMFSKLIHPWWPDGFGSLSYNLSVASVRGMLALFSLAGISSVDTDRLFLAIPYGLAAAFMYLLALEIARSRAAALVAAVWYPLGILYALAISGNENNVIALPLMPLLAYLAIRSVRRRSALVWYALASTMLGFIAANPPTTVLVAGLVGFLYVVGCSVQGVPARRFVLHGALLIAAAVLVNIWWLVPALVAIRGSSLTTVGAADLTWTLRRSDPIHILEQTAFWEFGTGIEPWLTLGRWYDTNVAARLALLATPMLAFAAIALVREGRARLAVTALASAALVAVFLGKGVREPFGAVNAFLYDHVPPYFLYREPDKFVFVPALVFPLLAGMTFAALPARVSRWLAAAVFAAVPIVTGLPLLTGSVFAFTAPHARIEVPDAWLRTAAYLNAVSSDNDRVLLLPEYGSNWPHYRSGMSTVDRIAETTLRRPIVRLVVGDDTYSYLLNERGVGTVGLLKEVIRRGDPREAEPALRRLGIGYVIVHGDLYPDGNTMSVSEVHGLLAGLHARRVAAFGSLEVYRLWPAPPFNVPARLVHSCIQRPNDLRAALQLPADLSIERASPDACREPASALHPVHGRVALEAGDVFLYQSKSDDRARRLWYTRTAVPARIGIGPFVDARAQPAGAVRNQARAAAWTFAGLGAGAAGSTSGGMATITRTANRAGMPAPSACLRLPVQPLGFFMMRARLEVHNMSAAGVSVEWYRPGGAADRCGSGPRSAVSRQSIFMGGLDSKTFNAGELANGFGVPPDTAYADVVVRAGPVTTLERAGTLSFDPVDVYDLGRAGQLPAIAGIVAARIDTKLSDVRVIAAALQPVEFIFRLPDGVRLSALLTNITSAVDPRTAFEGAYQAYEQQVGARSLRLADVTLETIVPWFRPPPPARVNPSFPPAAFATVQVAYEPHPSRLIAEAVTAPRAIAVPENQQAYLGRAHAVSGSDRGVHTGPWWSSFTISGGRGIHIMRQAYDRYWEANGRPPELFDGFAPGWDLAPGEYLVQLHGSRTPLILLICSLLTLVVLCTYAIVPSRSAR